MAIAGCWRAPGLRQGSHSGCQIFTGWRAFLSVCFRPPTSPSLPYARLSSSGASWSYNTRARPSTDCSLPPACRPYGVATTGAAAVLSTCSSACSNGVCSSDSQGAPCRGDLVISCRVNYLIKAEFRTWCDPRGQGWIRRCTTPRCCSLLAVCALLNTYDICSPYRQRSLQLIAQSPPRH